MGRPRRIDAGGYCYHVLNRGNGRMTVFEDAGDYDAFERILEEAAAREPGVGVLSYCLMPNHWHLVVRPTAAGELSRFVRWLTRGRIRGPVRTNEIFTRPRSNST